MESNDRRQRQSNTAGYVPVQDLQDSSQYPIATSGGSFRQPGVQPSPTSAPVRRGGTGPGYEYAYGENTQFSGMQAEALQYQPEYAASTVRASHGPQQYGQFGSNIVYAPPSLAHTTAYESIQRFQQQQPQQMAAAEVLSTQFSNPQQQYYMPVAGGASHASAHSSTNTPQNLPSQYQSLSYSQQSPVGPTRPQLGPAFGSGVTSTSPTQAGSTHYSPAYTAQAAHDVEAHYSQYQTELRRANEAIRDGRLAEAGNALVRVTEWLLTNVEMLGLTRDDEAVHAERLSLWQELNHSWLATLQMQKDILQGRQTSSQQTIIDIESLRSMGNDLVRLCDGIEKHGLVDYQMGVWEESIMSLLMQCLDILEKKDGLGTDPSRSN